MSTATRAEVYAALDSERDYQEDRKDEAAVEYVKACGAPRTNWFHEVASYLTYIRDYLTQAEHVATRNWGPEADLKTMHALRKVATLCVACMEEHGAPQRERYERPVIEPADDVAKIIQDLRRQVSSLHEQLGHKDYYIDEAEVDANYYRAKWKRMYGSRNRWRRWGVAWIVALAVAVGWVLTSRL